MLRTAGLLAFLKEGFVSRLRRRSSPDIAAQLLGGWDLTEAGLAPASPSGLRLDTPQARHSPCLGHQAERHRYISVPENVLLPGAGVRALLRAFPSGYVAPQN